MKFKRRCIGVLIVFASIAAQAQETSFTVNDDIGMVRFNAPLGKSSDAVAQFSPDGKHFAVVSSRGLLEEDQIESTISLFDTANVEAFVRSGETRRTSPRIHVTARAPIRTDQYDNYGAIISDLQWSQDSSTLYYLAETSHMGRRLYSVELEDGQPLPLSPPGYNVARFALSKSVIVFSAWAMKPPSTNNREQSLVSETLSVSGIPLPRILFPDSTTGPSSRELWTIRFPHGKAEASRMNIPPLKEMGLIPEAFNLSPSGHYLIQLYPVDHVPVSWSEYAPHPGFEYRKLDVRDPNIIDPNNIDRLKEYGLVALDTGLQKAVIDAPQDFPLAYSYESSAVWGSDEAAVLVTNTFLPLDGVDREERLGRISPCAVAAVRLPSLAVSCVVRALDLGRSVLPETLSFGGSDNEVDFQIRLPNGVFEKHSFTFDGTHWILTHTSPVTGLQEPALSVAVREGLNTAPRLWASDKLTARSKELWDPNPSFAVKLFGHATEYRWTDRNGHEWKGGLITPVGYEPGKRYPLVIQVYDFSPQLFLTDGSFPTAFAGRELASSGIAVLQMQRRLPHTINDDEAQSHVEGFRSAIEHLSSEGLIDPNRVGLVGFSSTAWYVETALIRDPKRYAAATIAEGADISYLQYRLLGVSDPGLRAEYEKIIGAKPQGTGLQNWMKYAPGFHLDQIEAPLRIEATTPAMLLGEWEIYASLRMQGKPVDLIYFKQGQHIHQQPLERFVSQQGDVDWFRFWLAGQEDDLPEKRSMYQHWETIKRNASTAMHP